MAVPAKIQGRFWPILIVSVAGRYSLIWPIWPDSGQISPVRHESGRIGHIGSYQLVTETAETSLESSRNSRNSHLSGIVMCFLPSSFFVL